MAQKKTTLVIGSKITEELLASIKAAIGDKVEVVTLDIDQLKADLKDLGSQNKSLAKQVNELMANGSNETLQAELDELKSEIANLRKVKEEQDQIITELMTVQKNFEKGIESGKPTVVVDDEVYELVIPSFNFKGESFNHSKLRANDSVCRELIKIGSNVLKKI